VRPADVSDSFLLDPSPRHAVGSEPVLEPRFSTASAGESLLTTANPADEKREQTRNSRPLPMGLVGSLALHLLPLLLLLSWATAPADIPTAIPIQLVIETPPPPPAPEAQKPTPRGPLASEDMGPVTSPTKKPATPVPEVAPELKTALAAPQPPPDPLPGPDASLELPLLKPKPIPKPAAHKPDSAVHIAGPSMWRVLGQPATRDEYFALLKTLTQRHLYLLPPSLIGGRRGETDIAILILGDGRIARIAVARSSGYPDIDERVERMVAAVGRFPPLPARFQEASLEVILHLRFPEGVER
jgi:outer membrane biosynthesis protein TonB